jgi:hypothetical protein
MNMRENKMCKCTSASSSTSRLCCGHALLSLKLMCVLSVQGLLQDSNERSSTKKKSKKTTWMNDVMCVACLSL